MDGLEDPISHRGVEEYALGHSVSTARPAHGEPSSPSFLAENACGDGLTGVLPSQESVKQEILNVNLRIPRYSDVGA